jgi:multidrug efflux pump subunit AcrB
MRALTQASLRSPAAVAVGVAITILFGAFALNALPVQLFPDIDRPQIGIGTQWRAETPREIESQILEPEELAPNTFGDLRLVESESGGLQEVTFGRYRMKSYQQTVQDFVQRLREYCTKRGINFFMAPSNMDLQDLLLKQLRKSEVWG